MMLSIFFYASTLCFEIHTHMIWPDEPASELQGSFCLCSSVLGLGIHATPRRFSCEC